MVQARFVAKSKRGYRWISKIVEPGDAGLIGVKAAFLI